MAASTAFFSGDYASAKELLAVAAAAAQGADAELGKSLNAAITDSMLGLSSRSELLLRLESLLAGKDWTAPSTDRAPLFFNMASIHFDKHRDEHARVLVDGLFDKLALAPSLDLGLSVKICVLLIEVHVRIWCSRGGTPCHSGEQRVAMQQRMHSAFGRLDEYLSILGDAPMLSSSEVDNGKQRSHQNSTSPGRKNLSNALKFRILLYRSRVLMCFGQLAHASEALGRAIEVYEADLQPLLLKDAEKGPIPGLTTCKDDNGAYYGASFGPKQLQRQFAWAGLYRAQLECLRTQDGDKGVKHKVERLLVSPAALSSPDAANNTACTCLVAGKYHAATLFMAQAVTAEKEKAKLVAGEGELKVEGVGSQAARSPEMEQTYYFEMLYNQGVALLLAGRARDAFLCLQKTKPVLGPQLPYLWIRMAECCIHVNHSRMHTMKAEFGEGVLLQDVAAPQKTDPGMSLAHASKYLVTALSMIRQRCPSSASAASSVAAAAPALPTALGADKADEPDEFEAEGESAGQFLRLEELVLTHSAYVHLCLGDNMLAVAVSREILARPSITESTR